MSSNINRSDVLNSFSEDLKKEINTIERNEVKTEKIEDYDRNTHWQKMGLCCDLISKECTKMAVAFSRPPLPSAKDSSLLLRDIGKALDMLLSWYKAFPAEEGKILHQVLRNCISCVLSSVCDFVESSNRINTANSGTNITVSTGTVWESCDSFKTLPKDNTSAVKKNIDDSYKLINDAIDEIQEALKSYEEDQPDIIDDTNSDEEDNFEDEKWKEEDVHLIKPSIGLMMASKGLLKKIKTGLTTAQKHGLDSPSETDVLMDHVNRLSPSIDDLVMLLYPPINRQEFSKQTVEMKETIQDIIVYVQNSTCLGTVENQSWITFIQKAVNHNIDKLNVLTSSVNNNGN